MPGGWGRAGYEPQQHWRFNSLLEMQVARSWHVVALNGRFQFSIGDADIGELPAPPCHGAEVSILYWRCTWSGAEEFTPSDIRLSILHWRC